MEKHAKTTIVGLKARASQVEPRSKKRRKKLVFFSYKEDEQICLAVIAAITATRRPGEKWYLPLMNNRWFATNLINEGLLRGRTPQVLKQRFQGKLHIILSDAFDWANVNNAYVLKKDLEMLVSEKLRVLHGLEDSVVEEIQVELSL